MARSAYNPRYFDETTPQARACEVEGCGQLGEHKAPRSREALHDYRWLCLDHVREFNKSWNYFEGMSAHEIEDFNKSAIFGHRPTWKVGMQGGYSPQKLEEALYRFWQGREAKSPEPQLPPEDRHALATLELEGNPDKAEIKARYKTLVKRHHPDMNKGDKTAEEVFKKIAAAYRHLMQRHGHAAQ